MSRDISSLSTAYDPSKRLQDHMRLFGYEIRDLPLIGTADLFLVKAGDELINRLVTFERFGQDLALRPEFTALAADQVFRERLPTDITRWQFQGPIFQDVFDSGAHDYQQFSMGAELIGMSGVVADAEIIGMAVLGLTAVGLDNIHITLGHAGLARSVLKHYQLDSQTERFLFQQQDVLGNGAVGKNAVLETLWEHLQLNSEQWYTDTDQFWSERVSNDPQHLLIAKGSRTSQDIARRMMRKQRRRTEIDQITAAIEFLGEWGRISGPPDEAFMRLNKLIPNDSEKEIVKYWHQVVNLLGKYGISEASITIQPSLVRSWEYYSGIVFDLKTPGQHLGGGGRYDGLAQLLGGMEDVPAIGFAYYMDNVVKALSDYIQANHVSNTAMLYFSSELAEVAVSLGIQLRNHGVACALMNKPEDHLLGEVLSLKDPSTIDFRGRSYSIDQIELLAAHLGQEL